MILAGAGEAPSLNCPGILVFPGFCPVLAVRRVEENQNPPCHREMPNKRQVRVQEFELHREWARKQTTEDLKSGLRRLAHLEMGARRRGAEAMKHGQG